MLRNKKADASDMITFLIIVFFLAVSFLVANFANSEIENAIRTTALNSTSVAVPAADQINTITTKTVQRTFVVMISFLAIGMMISSFMVRVHPIFLFLYIFMLAVTIFVTAPLANAYESVMNSGALYTVASQQTMINWIMEHLVGVMLGVGALSMMVLFGKLRGQSEGGNDF